MVSVCGERIAHIDWCHLRSDELDRVIRGWLQCVPLTLIGTKIQNTDDPAVEGWRSVR